MKKIEKKDRPYTVESYNYKWKEIFETEKKKIFELFGDKVVAIEHIGSTSIPGMWAKPQIDIMVVVRNFDFVNDAFVGRMKKINYLYRGDFTKERGEKIYEKYFVRDGKDGRRLISLHVIKKGSPKVLGHMYFRDYLIQNSDERNLYSEVKKMAYDKGSDRVEYSKEKKDVLLLILKRAKNWYLKNINKYKI